MSQKTVIHSWESTSNGKPSLSTITRLCFMNHLRLLCTTQMKSSEPEMRVKHSVWMCSLRLHHPFFKLLLLLPSRQCRHERRDLVGSVFLIVTAKPLRHSNNCKDLPIQFRPWRRRPELRLSDLRFSIRGSR